MPFYEYRCPNGHTFEMFQRMSDDPAECCEECGASPVEKILFPVAVHYKGSGFYSTDYGRGSRKGTGKEGDGGGGSGEGGSGSGSGSGEGGSGSGSGDGGSGSGSGDGGSGSGDKSDSGGKKDAKKDSGSSDKKSATSD
ncbi:MAG: zinc ribbon domain-containing protein [Thermoleophilia bacterium]